RHSVQRHPLLHADTDGGNLVLATLALVGPAHPHADAITTALADHFEDRKRANDPFFEGGNEAAYVGTAALEIHHHIGNALARPMIGHLPAAAACMDGKPRIDDVGGIGACAGRIE